MTSSDLPFRLMYPASLNILVSRLLPNHALDNLFEIGKGGMTPSGLGCFCNWSQTICLSAHQHFGSRLYLEDALPI